MDKIMDKREARAQKRIHLALPKYSLAEEITNAVTHGLGAALAIAGLVVLLIYSPKTPLAIISVCLYGASMFLLYMVSTLYHSLGVNRAKKVFQVLDHCTIFFLIAGTYTPISLLCIGGTVGWVLVSIRKVPLKPRARP